MYKKLFFIIAVPFVMLSCNKKTSSDCGYTKPSSVASAAEVANLKAYLDANSLPYTPHPGGFFYNIVSPGSGATPGVCSGVTVKYLGQLTNGTGFDSSYKRDPAGTSFTLGGLIEGWKYGIPLIKNGGSIKLYIPPSLGYGSSANGAIPANSNLIFTIELVNVQ